MSGPQGEGEWEAQLARGFAAVEHERLTALDAQIWCMDCRARRCAQHSRRCVRCAKQHGEVR